MSKVRIYETDTGSTLGSRLGRFVVLFLVIFGVTGAVIVTSRFSSETLALVVGLLLAGVPLLCVLALVGFVFLKIAAKQREQPAPQQMMLPPIIMQMPQQPPAFPPPYGQVWGEDTGRRTWDIVGVDED